MTPHLVSVHPARIGTDDLGRRRPRGRRRIPTSFCESGGSQHVDVAVAFDPPGRPPRLDYLGQQARVCNLLVREAFEADEVAFSDERCRPNPSRCPARSTGNSEVKGDERQTAPEAIGRDGSGRPPEQSIDQPLVAV